MYVCVCVCMCVCVCVCLVANTICGGINLSKEEDILHEKKSICSRCCFKIYVLYLTYIKESEAK